MTVKTKLTKLEKQLKSKLKPEHKPSVLSAYECIFRVFDLKEQQLLPKEYRIYHSDYNAIYKDLTDPSRYDKKSLLENERICGHRPSELETNRRIYFQIKLVLTRLNLSLSHQGI